MEERSRCGGASVRMKRFRRQGGGSITYRCQVRLVSKGPISIPRSRGNRSRKLKIPNPARGLNGEFFCAVLNKVNFPLEMRLRLPIICLVIFVASTTFICARTINDIPEARETLRRTVSHRLYKELAISPVEGWIQVKGELAKDRVINAKVIHSELNGKYDSMALELAGNLRMLNYTNSGRSSDLRNVVLHLLIYQIADGKMALSFAHLSGTGASQLAYSGTAWMAVQTTGPWRTVEPLHLIPNERNGPRSYTFAVEYPDNMTILGNGRLPSGMFKLQGGQKSPFHRDGPR